MRFATATEVVNKQAVTAAVTPKNVADMFLGRLGIDPWIDLPNGFIVQWVSGNPTTIGDADFTINFPKPFPTACLFIMVSTKGGATSQTDGVFQERSFNRTSCVVNSQVFGTGSISSGITPKILAFGY